MDKNHIHIYFSRCVLQVWLFVGFVFSVVIYRSFILFYLKDDPEWFHGKEYWFIAITHFIILVIGCLLFDIVSILPGCKLQTSLTTLKHFQDLPTVFLLPLDPFHTPLGFTQPQVRFCSSSAGAKKLAWCTPAVHCRRFSI